MLTVMAFAPPDGSWKVRGGAHHVREVRDGDEQAHDGDQCVGVEHAEADEQEDQTPDEAAEVESRVRVDAGDIAQRMVLVDARRVGISPNSVFGALYCTRVLDAAMEVFEPEDDHARAETVSSDDVLLAGRVSEFGHGLCGFGHVLLPFCFLLCFFAPLFLPYGRRERERSDWFRRAVLLADGDVGSGFCEVPPAYVKPFARVQNSLSSPAIRMPYVGFRLFRLFSWFKS